MSINFTTSGLGSWFNQFCQITYFFYYEFRFSLSWSVPHSSTPWGFTCWSDAQSYSNILVRRSPPHVCRVRRPVTAPEERLAVEQTPALRSLAGLATHRFVLGGCRKQEVVWSVTNQPAGWTCCWTGAAGPPRIKGGAVRQGHTPAVRSAAGALVS